MALARIYLLDEFYIKDIYSSLELLRLVRNCSRLFDKEISDLIANVDNPIYYSFALIILEDNIQFDWAIIRLARAYRDGRGVEKDYSKAEGLYAAAVEKNPAWTYEFCDFLWKRAEPSSDARMVAVATEMSKRGNADANGWLARAYRDGRGVEKNVEKSIELFSLASSKNKKWNDELIKTKASV